MIRSVDTGSASAPDLLRDLVDNLPCAAFVHDAAGRFREVNPTACRSLGRTRDSLLASDVFAIECEHRLILEQLWRSLAIGQQKAFRGRHRRADGSTFGVAVSVRAFAHYGEKLFCVTATPVASGDEADRNLQSTQKDEHTVFREVFERANEAIAIIDAEGRYVLQNRRHRELLGYDDQELVDKTPAIHLGPAKFREVAKALAERGEYRAEVTSHAKDGRALALELSAFAIERDGQPPLFVGIKRDLRERDREGRAAAERVRRELEESLRQAHKLEIFGLLAAGIAHDFNNVLTLVLSLSDLHADDPSLPEHARAAFADVRGAALRGRDLTARLLEFGRRQPLQPEPLDLEPRLRELIRALRRVVPTTIQFDVTIDGSLPTVLADAVAIEQVLLNLTTNAADAMPDGGTLTIRVERQQIAADTALARALGSGGEFVQLLVADTGTGMCKAALERMFEPFYTSKAAGKGTGLGMAIVQDIVRHHNGHIEVDSTVGRGTEVRVILPAAE
ncbi:MAG TPA: PAS domain-containing sensor histidine kinase [bacterium]|nr:PAS domain-containing sensor histidine kinase [bacterium]